MSALQIKYKEPILNCTFYTKTKRQIFEAPFYSMIKNVLFVRCRFFRKFKLQIVTEKGYKYMNKCFFLYLLVIHFYLFIAVISPIVFPSYFLIEV